MKNKSIPLAPVGAFVYSALLSPHPWGSDSALDHIKAGNFELAARDTLSRMFFMTPDFRYFDWSLGLRFWAPTVIGIGIHKTLGRFINPYMKRIPMIGKYVQI